LNLSRSFSHTFDINNQHSVYYHFYIVYQCLAFLERLFLDTNDHGDKHNVNYVETHLKEYGHPNLSGQNISIQDGESPSRRNIHENTYLALPLVLPQ
jgi:hypothetical protein